MPSAEHPSAKRSGKDHAIVELTPGNKPPVNTVKNFVHLLNDSDFDFNEEIEFERLRKTVVQQILQNEMAEQYIDQLDIKIALLVKNKITLDDVMQHQKNFGGHRGTLLSNTSISSVNQFDLKALNKNSRKKLESYQQLFFTLQTQPQHLARLFKRIREHGTAEQECKRIETLMMGLVGYAQNGREEYCTTCSHLSQGPSKKKLTDALLFKITYAATSSGGSSWQIIPVRRETESSCGIFSGHLFGIT